MKKHIAGSLLFILLCCVLSSFLISCNNQPTKPDSELYMSFYLDIMGRAKGMDARCRPFVTAIENGKLLDAINVGKEMEDHLRSSWSKLDGMDVPVLKNAQAFEELKKAKESLANAYFFKLKSLTEFLKYTKSPSLDSMAILKKNGENFQALLISGLASLISAGGKLGFTVTELNEARKQATNK